MSAVKLGVTLPQFTADPARLLDGARRAADAGLDSAWLFDHMWPLSGGKERPILEQWTTLAFLAARGDIHLGTFVTRSSLRSAAVLAKMAATVASIAPGRVTVGLGSGDELSRAENEAFGLPYWSGEERIDQLAAELEVLRGYLSNDSVTFADRFGSIEALPASPRPRPPPPVWLGGRSPALLQLAGRRADGWNGWGMTADDFRARAAEVVDAADGRTVELSWGGIVQLEESDSVAESKAAGKQRHAVGSAATVAARLAALVEAGASHLVVTFPNAGTPGPYELLGHEVRTALAV